MTNWLTQEEISSLGYTVGKNVKISRLARIYTTSFSVGDFTRIDDYAIITGCVSIGRHTHIPPFSCLYGAYGIIMEDYAGVSPMCQIYSTSDDYKGHHLMGGSVPLKYRGPHRGTVLFRAHAVLGANCIVLPGVVLPEGSTFGTFSLITNNKYTLPWHVHRGQPAKPVEKRSKWVLEEEKALEEEENAMQSL